MLNWAIGELNSMGSRCTNLSNYMGGWCLRKLNSMGGWVKKKCRQFLLLCNAHTNISSNVRGLKLVILESLKRATTVLCL